MSSSAVKSQGTTLHIAGTAGGAKNISAISVGNPTIITSNAHGLANGDVVAIASITGTVGTDATNGLNGKSFTVEHKTTNTFAVNVDSTGLAYTSGGTATPSSWIKVGDVTDIKGGQDSVSDIVRTDLDSSNVEKDPGLDEFAPVTIEVHCVDSDTGLAAIEAAYTAKSTKSFKITHPSGSTPVRTFSAWVKSVPHIGNIPLNGVITGSVELQRTTVVTKS
jgi:hypothetical protein